LNGKKGQIKKITYTERGYKLNFLETKLKKLGFLPHFRNQVEKTWFLASF
jgi:hypothetical protein